MLCLEDGWDLTCQVSSLAQLCLDPHYRTVSGFRTLVEKEWVAYGHRFNHRSNLDNSSPDPGFTPIFLQFLDIVHQLHNQFPMAFEFSQFYLKFLAYHHVSCRFRTFLLDSEFQRSELGFLNDSDKKNSLGNGRVNSRHHTDLHSSDEEVGPGHSSSLPGSHLGLSIFDYLEQASLKGPQFHNPLYCPELQQPVLRPFSHLSDLVLWDYYTTEELRYGPPYDLEVLGLEQQQEEEDALDDMDLTMRPAKHCLSSGYDNLAVDHPNSTSHLLANIERLEMELGHLPHRWHHHWSQLEAPPPHPPPPPPHTAGHSPTPATPAQATTPSMYVRHYSRSMHKRSTIELLLRGKMGGVGPTGATPSSEGSYTQPHRFEKYNYTTPTYCDLCNTVLWGIVRTGYRCQDCGLNCHEKCRENVPKACTKLKSVTRDPTSDNLDQLHGGVGGSLTGGLTGQGAHQDNTMGYQFSIPTNQDENSNIICQGYLYKRGALLKAWKPRWFVLDTIKHQLRYYDSREDFHIKGAVDLSEIRSVTQPASLPPGAPKKADERCCFDLHTSRRQYSLCAESRQQADEWKEKIQNCL